MKKLVFFILIFALTASLVQAAEISSNSKVGHVNFKSFFLKTSDIPLTNLLNSKINTAGKNIAPLSDSYMFVMGLRILIGGLVTLVFGTILFSFSLIFTAISAPTSNPAGLLVYLLGHFHLASGELFITPIIFLCGLSIMILGVVLAIPATILMIVGKVRYSQKIVPLKDSLGIAVRF